MSGYYRFPTINNNLLVFVCEDDLWSLKLNNNSPLRLTTNHSEVSSPLISPDGQFIAYIGREDGNTEIFLISTNGGKSKRLTYEGGLILNIAAWKNNYIYYSSTIDTPFTRTFDLRKININGGQSIPLNYGMTRNISFNTKGTVIGRNTGDIARWKRYKGGTAGKLLIDINNKLNFKSLLNINGNIANPLWIKNKIFFISDHEGIGNLYSCNSKGQNITKHTHHKNYFTRNATTDNANIVYHAGADLYIFNVKSNNYKKVDIVFNGSKIQTSRKYIDPKTYIENNIGHYLELFITQSYN